MVLFCESELLRIFTIFQAIVALSATFVLGILTSLLTCGNAHASDEMELQVRRTGPPVNMTVPLRPPEFVAFRGHARMQKQVVNRPAQSLAAENQQQSHLVRPLQHKRAPAAIPVAAVTTKKRVSADSERKPSKRFRVQSRCLIRKTAGEPSLLLRRHGPLNCAT